MTADSPAAGPTGAPAPPVPPEAAGRPKPARRRLLDRVLLRVRVAAVEPLARRTRRIVLAGDPLAGLDGRRGRASPSSLPIRRRSPRGATAPAISSTATPSGTTTRPGGWSSPSTTTAASHRGRAGRGRSVPATASSSRSRTGTSSPAPARPSTCSPGTTRPRSPSARSCAASPNPHGASPSSNATNQTTSFRCPAWRRRHGYTAAARRPRVRRCCRPPSPSSTCPPNRASPTSPARPVTTSTTSAPRATATQASRSPSTTASTSPSATDLIIWPDRYQAAGPVRSK